MRIAVARMQSCYDARRRRELNRLMDNTHAYVIGRSGFGKSTLLKNEIFMEIQNADRAVFFIDPHGRDALDLIDAIPSQHHRRLCYIDVSDTQYAVGFRPLLEPQHGITTFKDIWHESWGPRLEWWLFNGLALILEAGVTLLTLPLLYYDRRTRLKLLENVGKKSTREFWLREYPSYNERQQQEGMSPILNKVGQLLASDISRHLVQKHPKLDLRQAITDKMIVVLNLSKGTIGDEAAHILGSVFTTTLRQAAMDVRLPVSLFADEFQNYGTSIFVSLLSEMRKFGLRLILAHQFADQIEPRLLSAILGNVKDIYVFNVGHASAVLLAPQFNRDQQPFNPSALTTTPPYSALLNGIEIALPPFDAPKGSLTKLLEQSRRRYGRKLTPSPPRRALTPSPRRRKI